MAVFPPSAPVTVVIDGRPMWSYNGAYEAAGRIYAPIRPFVTTIADRIWFDGSVLTIVRDGRTVTIRMQSQEPDALDRAYIPLAPVLRALGESVQYAAGRRLLVRTVAPAVVATPSPFNNALPSSAPHPVFTPTTSPTERPVWTGSPLPRRTPLPFPTPRRALRSPCDRR